MFVDLMFTLISVEGDRSMKPVVRVKAKGYIEALLNYEIILSAQTFLCIFQHTSPPPSIYRHTEWVYWQLIVWLKGQRIASKHVGDFEGVKGAADEFVSWANEKLQEMGNYELVVQTALPEKWIRKKNARRAFRR